MGRCAGAGTIAGLAFLAGCPDSNVQGHGHDAAGALDADTPTDGAAPDAGVDGTLPDAPPTATLVTSGLVARYFLDEAASGDGTGTVLDAAPSPLSLALTFVTVTTRDPHYVSAATGRGLEWGSIENDGRACVDVAGTKIATALQGRKQATYEAVVDIDAGSSSGTRLLHVGDGSTWRFSLGYFPTLQSAFYASPDGVTSYGANWDQDLATEGRVVETLVVDTTAAVDADRVRLYRNGTLLTAASQTVTPLQLDQTFNVSAASTFFCIGNRQIGGRSPQGRIYYGALYDRVLSASEIADNAALLLVNDDTP